MVSLKIASTGFVVGLALWALPTYAANAVPAAPANLVVTVATSSVPVDQGRLSASWDAVNGAKGYSVVAKSGGLVVASSTVTAPLTSATLSGLVGGVTYDVSVQATDSSGFGSASSIVQATAITVPRTPTITSAVVSGSTTAVTWVAPENGGSPISGYSVTQAATSTSTSVGGSVLTTSFNNTSYTSVTDYTITASNAAGTSTTGSTAIATPTAPRALATTGSAGAITATWNAPSSNGGASVTAYVVVLKQGVTTIDTQEISGTSASWSGKTDGTYTVQVSAKNSAGSGLPANSIITLSGGGGVGISPGGTTSSGAETGGAITTVVTTPAPSTTSTSQSGVAPPTSPTTGSTGAPAPTLKIDAPPKTPLNVGGGITVLTLQQTQLANKPTLSGTPSSSATSAPSVNVSVNMAVAPKVSALPKATKLDVQMKINGAWVDLGSARTNSSGGATLPAFKPSKPGTYLIELSTPQGKKYFVKVVVKK